MSYNHSQVPGLYIVNEENKGRCVYSSIDITKDSVIEVCPVILLDQVDTKTIHKTSLYDYYFVWDIEANTSAIALGYGSLYNHSESPNAEYKLNIADMEIQIIAIDNINAGSEITFRYIDKNEEEYKLWFDPVK